MSKSDEDFVNALSFLADVYGEIENSVRLDDISKNVDDLIKKVGRVVGENKELKEENTRLKKEVEHYENLNKMTRSF